MKKIGFLFLFFVFSASTFAQSFSLSDPLGTIPDGGSRTYTTPANIPILPGDYNVTLHNISGTALSVICSKEIIDTIAGTESAFCWGQCFPASVYSSSPVLVESGDSGIFNPDYKPNGHTGESHVRFIFSEDGNRDNKISFIATFQSTPVSVSTYAQNIGKLVASPNPASSQITVDYSINDANENLTLTVKNLLGAVVYSSNLIAATGKIAINTSDFIDGIYFISILSNNMPVNSKKLVIRH